MNFRDKLKRVTEEYGAITKPASEASPLGGGSDANAQAIESEGGARLPHKQKLEKITRIRSLLAAMEARRPALRVAPAPARRPTLPFVERETLHGTAYVLDRYLEPHHCHGRARLDAALRISSAVIAKLALDCTLADVDMRRMLLLDTETTGLSGGTGTIAFLVGMAWFEDESLRVQQLFVPSPNEEAPMLRVLLERIEQASCVVTFNGKSFDWPLLRTRFLLHRMQLPHHLPHLDLLHCARRVFRRRLGATRLVHLESQVLGMRREYDIDGAEIPGIYLGFLRGGDPSALDRVIEHNGNDLVALAALIGRLGAHFETLRTADDPWDHLGYAELAARGGDVERAMEFARAAAEGGGNRDCTLRALLVQAKLARARKTPSLEQAVLERALDVAPTPLARAGVHLALAKLYEHKLRDPARALANAQYTRDAEPLEAHERRTARLTRRLGAIAQPPEMESSASAEGGVMSSGSSR